MGRGLMSREVRAVKLHLRYLVEDVDRHGNVRVYFRRVGMPKIRLRARPGTPEFIDEYRRAVEGMAQAGPFRRTVSALTGSLRWLCQEYFQSVDFKGLGPSTRHARKLI